MTVSELVGLSTNRETPGIIIPAGTDDYEETNISYLGDSLLPKIKIWFLTEQSTATAQITSNPTEAGRVQNDNIILDPIAWNIKAKVTDVMGKFTVRDLTSLAGAAAETIAPGAGQYFTRAGAGVSNSVYDYLLRLRESRTPFTLVTSFGRVKNLFFQSLTFNRDKDTANSLPIQMALQELFISSATTAESDEKISPVSDYTSMTQPTETKGQQSGVTAS